MPPTLTYPGVYVQEISSGVRTITGVATSVAAFAGAAARGPINTAVHIFSFADYERRFGGLHRDSEMSYAIRQFFLNGGADAWVVRIVKSAAPATLVLQNDAGVDVIAVTALEPGVTGNDIEIRVGRVANRSVFELSVTRRSDGVNEPHAGLSMNSNDPRYAITVVNEQSQLVTLKRIPDDAAVATLPAGTWTSPDLVSVSTLFDATHKDIRISLNGLPSVAVALPVAPTLSSLAAAIEAQVRAHPGGEAYSNFTCTVAGQTIVMTSGRGGDGSSVRVLPAAANNASGRFGAGYLEIDGASGLLPGSLPARATLTSAPFGSTPFATLPSATKTTFAISLDGGAPQQVQLPGATPASTLPPMAALIETAVRSLNPNAPAYTGFTCTVSGSRLVLATGTRGSHGSVKVTAGASLDIAADLQLLQQEPPPAPVLPLPATPTPAPDALLTLGEETAYSAGDVYPSFIASRANRRGIYALESVELFNLLVLPGITDPGTLQDAVAYCEERRAFLIIDAPPALAPQQLIAPDRELLPDRVTRPDEMSTIIASDWLPKSDHAAVYYPWIKVADPLRNGKLRLTAPGGAIAGLYARTDAERGVWKAPAGTEAAIKGALGVSYQLTDPENGSLNPKGVNCIRSFPVYGIVSWGARTLHGDDHRGSEYKYVPVKRLALYIEESLFRGTQWVVFEPNDEPLWAQIRLNLGAFMNGLFRQGAFQGKTPRDAYMVKCDSELNPPNSVNQGVVNILVGFAPLKPAEFVVIRIQQLAGQIQV